MFEKYTVDLCCTVNIELHSRRGDNVFYITRYVTNPAPVLYTQSFHAWRNCKTNLIFSSRLSNVEKSIVTQRLITD